MASRLMQPSACILCYFVACSTCVLGFAFSAVQSVLTSLELGWKNITWVNVSDKDILAAVVQEFCKHILNSDFGFLLLLNFFVSLYAFIGVATSVSSGDPCYSSSECVQLHIRLQQQLLWSRASW